MELIKTALTGLERGLPGDSLVVGRPSRDVLLHPDCDPSRSRPPPPPSRVVPFADLDAWPGLGADHECHLTQSVALSRATTGVPAPEIPLICCALHSLPRRDDRLLPLPSRDAPDRQHDECVPTEESVVVAPLTN